MREYTLNFFIWFYIYKVKDFALTVYGRFVFILIYTRTLPMIRNIYKPMFGDNDLIGRLIGFFIRFWWSLFGLIISLVYITPFVIAFIIFILLPLIPIAMLIKYLSV
jgi:hypothetical protein